MFILSVILYARMRAGKGQFMIFSLCRFFGFCISLGDDAKEEGAGSAGFPFFRSRAERRRPWIKTMLAL